MVPITIKQSKLLFILLSIIIGNGLLTTKVMAADVNLYITGNIKAAPCKMATKDLNVNLGKVPASKMIVAGSTSPLVDATLKLTDCPLTTSYVSLRLEGEGDGDYFKNTGVAGNIAVEVLAEGVRIPPNGADIKKMVQADRTVTFPMKARIYSKGTATVGVVKATATMVITYE